jgi:hypothetical protein
MVATSAKPRYSDSNSPPPEPSAYVRIIELTNGLKGGTEAVAVEKSQHPTAHRGKHAASFPWRVLSPLHFPPRLRGLVLLNLVSRGLGQVGLGANNGGAALLPVQGSTFCQHGCSLEVFCCHMRCLE